MDRPSRRRHSRLDFQIDHRPSGFTRRQQAHSG